MERIGVQPGIVFLLAVFIALFGEAGAAEKQPPSSEEPYSRQEVEYKAEEFEEPFFKKLKIEKPAVKSGEPAQQEEAKKPLPNLVVKGIVWGGDLPLAIVNDKILMIGDTIEEARIVDISNKGIVVTFAGLQYNLPSPAKAGIKLKGVGSHEKKF